jgi:adenylosuccinate lyase
MVTSYVSPLSNRYASTEMQYLFSANNLILTWRRLWISLAEHEARLGAPISEDQLTNMKENYTNIDWNEIHEQESIVTSFVFFH